MRRYRLQVMLRPVVMWYTRNEIHISLPKLVNLCELATLRHHPYFLSNSFESTKLKITLHIEHALNNYCYAALPLLRLRNNVSSFSFSSWSFIFIKGWIRVNIDLDIWEQLGPSSSLLDFLANFTLHYIHECNYLIVF